MRCPDQPPAGVWMSLSGDRDGELREEDFDGLGYSFEALQTAAPVEDGGHGGGVEHLFLREIDQVHYQGSFLVDGGHPLGVGGVVCAGIDKHRREGARASRTVGEASGAGARRGRGWCHGGEGGGDGVGVGDGCLAGLDGDAEIDQQFRVGRFGESALHQLLAYGGGDVVICHFCHARWERSLLGGGDTECAVGFQVGARGLFAIH